MSQDLGSSIPGVLRLFSLLIYVRKDSHGVFNTTSSIYEVTKHANFMVPVKLLPFRGKKTVSLQCLFKSHECELCHPDLFGNSLRGIDTSSTTTRGWQIVTIRQKVLLVIN